MKIGIEHIVEKAPPPERKITSGHEQTMWDLHNRDISKYKLYFLDSKQAIEIPLTFEQFNILSNLIKIVQSNYEVTNIEVDEKK